MSPVNVQKIWPCTKDNSMKTYFEVHTPCARAVTKENEKFKPCVEASQ